MTWNSTSPIGVLTFVDLMEEVEPIPNYTVTRPLVVLSNVTCPLVRYKAWNCLSPAVKYFEAPVSIMTL
jgi:hypothetical protein